MLLPEKVIWRSCWTGKKCNILDRRHCGSTNQSDSHQDKNKKRKKKRKKLGTWLKPDSLFEFDSCVVSKLKNSCPMYTKRIPAIFEFSVTPGWSKVRKCI